MTIGNSVIKFFLSVFALGYKKLCLRFGPTTQRNGKTKCLNIKTAFQYLRHLPVTAFIRGILEECFVIIKEGVI